MDGENGLGGPGVRYAELSRAERLEVLGAELASRRPLSGHPIKLDGAADWVPYGTPIIAPAGNLRLVLVPTIVDGVITELDVIAEPDRLEQLELAVLS